MQKFSNLLKKKIFTFFKKLGFYVIVILACFAGLVLYFFNDIVSFLFPPGIEVGQSANFETLKFLVYLVGGGLLIWQIILTNRRTRAAEKTAISAAENIIILEKSQVLERFKNAIDQLGNTHEAVNLGAIYTLHHVAKDSKPLIKSVFDILCSYIREVTSEKDYQTKLNPSIKIQSILNLLFVDEVERIIYKELSANLDGANLSGAFLDNANFCNASLCNANFNKAVLKKANLSGADLLKADLTEAKLSGANMNGAFLNDVDFKKAEMVGASLIGANLFGADFSNADLCDSNLTRTKFSDTRLRGTVLCNANLCEAELIEANLTRTDLRDIQVDSPHWIKLLKKWNCIDYENIENKYCIVTSEKNGKNEFFVKLKTSTNSL